jgi:tetratricopeptide (TPR) repeat protein
VGAGLAESQSDHGEARRMLEECLELRRRLGNPTDIAATLSTLSLARLQGGDAEGAEAGEQEALKIFREVGQKRGEAVGLCHLGQICHRAGKEAEARSYLNEGLELAKKLGNKEIEGECQLVIGQLSYDEGQLPDAELWFKRSFTVCREAGDKRGEANATRWLGKCEIRRGQPETARDRLIDALRAYSSFEMWEELLGCLEDIAELILETNGRKAAQLLSAVAQARTRLNLHHSESEGKAIEGRIAALRAALGEEVFGVEWEVGGALDIREAIAQAQTPAQEPAFAGNETVAA